MNTQHEFALYSASNDTVFAVVRAEAGELALDAFARQYGFPTYEAMREAGVFSTLGAYRVH